MSGAVDRRRGEQGFTLLELLIVLIIISILVAAVWVAMRSAQVAARNDSMKAAAATIDTAIGTFNRMYPPIGGVADPLMPGATTGSNPWRGSSTRGLYDETGERLIAVWPADPFRSNATVEVWRYPGATSCANGRPGQVKVCRLPLSEGRLTYEIRAWGKDGNGATRQVYYARHGGR